MKGSQPFPYLHPPFLFSATKHPPLFQLEGELAASQLLWLQYPMSAACCEARSAKDGALTLLVKTQLLGTGGDFGKRKQPPLSLFAVLHLLGGGNLPWAFLSFLV